MKSLLIQTAKRSGIVDAVMLEDFFKNANGDRRRIDDILLSAPDFTEEMVLKLFAEALGLDYLSEISPDDVPA